MNSIGYSNPAPEWWSIYGETRMKKAEIGARIYFMLRSFRLRPSIEFYSTQKSDGKFASSVFVRSTIGVFKVVSIRKVCRLNPREPVRTRAEKFRVPPAVINSLIESIVQEVGATAKPAAELDINAGDSIL